MLLGVVAAVGFAATSAAADEYRYDALGRLIEVTYTNGAVVYYVYDAAGNRTTVVADPTGSALPPNNLAPDAVNDTGIEIERYTTADIYVLDNDSDPDTDPLTITSVSGTGGSIGPGGQYLVYTAGAVGLRTLNYTVSDGRGGTDTASVSITVILGYEALGAGGEGGNESSVEEAGAAADAESSAPPEAETSTSEAPPGGE